ncbi:hypothetical protein FPV67DRAFT_1436466 [Lyophyllum atratum]|nr:hypothetical protein FPV67DRAFT_1436466 [Lyophyllum atratum]
MQRLFPYFSVFDTPPPSNQALSRSGSFDAALGLLGLAQSVPNTSTTQPLQKLPLTPFHPEFSPTLPTLLSPLHLDFELPSFTQNRSNKENLTTLLPDPITDVPRLRKKALSKIDHVKNALSVIHQARISPAEFLTIILDDANQDFYDYRTAFYSENKTRRLEDLLNTIWSNEKGAKTMTTWFRPHAIDLICDIIHAEMDSAKPALQMSTKDVTTDFISSWDINALMEPVAERITPVWSRLLDAATETKKARDSEKPKTSRSRNLHYLRSRASAKVQIALGLVASATGTSREMINILHTACLSMSYNSISNIIDTLADSSIADARKTAASEPTLMAYDNINITTSIFVEQAPGAMSKVQSGTFGVLYKLYKSPEFKDMLAAPMMIRFQNSSPLEMSDVRGPAVARQSYHTQTAINVAHALFRYVTGFAAYPSHPKLQHSPRRKLSNGHKTVFHPLRATTIEEASVQGNLLNHDDIMVVQLQRAKEDLDKYMIPAINDQLTNARNRGAQILRGKDITPWSRREVLALAFGTFHMVMNFIWMVLQVHRGTIDQIGSLTHLFAIMEKVRLGAEHPDFHALLSALTQILDGLLLNAWRRECGDLDKFAASKPSTADILKVAHKIIKKYATPTNDMKPCEKEKTSNKVSSMPTDGGESGTSDEDDPAPNTTSPDRTKDTIHENVIRLTRDLLYVPELVSAIADGDFGRVEDILPDLACLFRGGGSNNYSNEILHFLFNLKEVWTPEFAEIMRDNMLVNPSGLPGHWMAIDLNIEHLIGYLKALFAAKGVYANWDRLGNISASIAQLQEIKTRVTRSMNTNYQSSTHHQRDASGLVWRIANKARDLELQDEITKREDQRCPRTMPDLRALGREKYASSSLATFNKKMDETKKGRITVDEEDTIPAASFADVREAEPEVENDEEDD